MAKKKVIKEKRLPKGFTIDPNMPDFSNDPVIKKKVAEAEADLKKFPLPDHLIFPGTGIKERKIKTNKKNARRQ